GVDRQRAQHVVHDDGAHAHVLDGAAAIAAGLEPDPAVGALEHAVADHDVAHAAAHLAADHHAAVAAHHRAAGDGDVLGRDAVRGALRAGLERDAVVPHVDVAVADAHVAAGFRVDAVGVRRLGGVVDVQVREGDVLAEGGVPRPGRRVAQGDIPDRAPLALVQADQGGTRMGQLLTAMAEGVPPDLPAAVDRAQAG